MKVLTTGCAQYGHPEFLVECDEGVVPAGDVEWLITHLESSVASGTRYRPQETIRIGWSEISLGTEGDHLVLLEPDWAGSVPFDYVASVTRALLHLRRQKDVADSLGLVDRMAFPSIFQSALVCDHIGKGILGVMDRAEAEGSDSGWFVGCDEPEHDHNRVEHLQPRSLYDVGCLLGATVQFYALPTGTNIVFGREGGISVTLDGKRVMIKNGSYLQQLILRTVQ